MLGCIFTEKTNNLHPFYIKPKYLSAAYCFNLETIKSKNKVKKKYMCTEIDTSLVE